jgi:hypothetical protein
MEAHREWLYQAKLLERKLCWVKLIRARGDVLGKRAVTLYTERLVKLARVWPTTSARRTLATAGVRRQGHVCTSSEVGTARRVAEYRRCNLMPKNAWKTYHWVLPAIAIEIAATQTDSPDLEQYLSRFG